MHTLEAYVLPVVFFLVLMMVAILWLGVYFFVRIKRTILSISLMSTLVSLFFMFFFLCMNIILFDLKKATMYNKFYQISLLISIVLVAITTIALFYTRRKRMLHIYMMPDLASVFNKAQDAILIQDQKGNILEMNQAARNIQVDFTALLKEQGAFGKIEKGNEVCIANKWYYLQSAYLHVRNDIVGKIWLFHSVQEEKQLLESVRNSNRSLEKANAKLLESLRVEEELAEEKIRLDLIKKVQRELILDIEEAISEMNKLIDHNGIEKEVMFQKIKDLAQRLRGTMASIRRSVMNLSGRKG